MLFGEIFICCFMKFNIHSEIVGQPMREKTILPISSCATLNVLPVIAVTAAIIAGWWCSDLFADMSDQVLKKLSNEQVHTFAPSYMEEAESNKRMLGSLHEEADKNNQVSVFTDADKKKDRVSDKQQEEPLQLQKRTSSPEPKENKHKNGAVTLDALDKYEVASLLIEKDLTGDGVVNVSDEQMLFYYAYYYEYLTIKDLSSYVKEKLLPNKELFDPNGDGIVDDGELSLLESVRFNTYVFVANYLKFIWVEVAKHETPQYNILVFKDPKRYGFNDTYEVIDANKDGVVDFNDYRLISDKFNEAYRFNFITNAALFEPMRQSFIGSLNRYYHAEAGGMRDATYTPYYATGSYALRNSIENNGKGIYNENSKESETGHRQVKKDIKRSLNNQIIGSAFSGQKKTRSYAESCYYDSILQNDSWRTRFDPNDDGADEAYRMLDTIEEQYGVLENPSGIVTALVELTKEITEDPGLLDEESLRAIKEFQDTMMTILACESVKELLGIDFESLKILFQDLSATLQEARADFARSSEPYYDRMYEAVMGAVDLWWATKDVLPTDYFRNSKRQLVDFALQNLQGARTSDDREDTRLSTILTLNEELARSYLIPAVTEYKKDVSRALTVFSTKADRILTGVEGATVKSNDQDVQAAFIPPRNDTIK